MKTKSQPLYVVLIILTQMLSVYGYSMAPKSSQNIFSSKDFFQLDPEYNGAYTFTQQGTVMTMTISNEEEKLTLKISTEPNTVYSLKPINGKKDEFTVNEGNNVVAGVIFKRDNKGKVTSFIFMQGNGKYEWKKKK